MVSTTQKKGIMWGLTWGLLSWVPYYTDYLGNIRGVLGIPATLGLNLELVLGRGDAFIYSLILAMGMGFVGMTLVQIFSKNVTVIFFRPIAKNQRFFRRRKGLLRKGL